MTDGTALYRFYDTNETLLYVGITDDPRTRWRSHASTKAWWPDVANRTVEWFPSRDAAETAEREAIFNEKPVHNIRGVAGIKPLRTSITTPWTTYMAEVSGGASQSEIARRLKLTASSVGRWYVSRPTIHNVVAFAKEYKVSVVEALIVAEYISEEDAQDNEIAAPLSSVPTNALLAEIGRRARDY